MLYRTSIEGRCAYCAHAGDAGEGQMICTRQGIVPASHVCRAFRYDPLKRVPEQPKAPDFEKYDKADFSL